MKNNVTFPALIIVLAAMICGIGYYLISAAGKKDASLEEQHEETKVELKKEPKQEEPPAIINQENQVPDQEIPKPVAMPNTEPASPQAPNQNDRSKADAFLDEALRTQVPRIYEDLFKELNLPEEQRKQVEGHLAKVMKAKANFEMKILDPNVPVEELLRDQDRLLKEGQAGLGGILGQREQDVVAKHQNELPLKMQKKQAEMLADTLNLQGNEKEKVTNVLERAMQKMEQNKNIGQYTEQDITDARKKFAGAKPGSQEFLRATIEESTKRVKSFGNYIEQELPKEQSDVLKKQLEMPLEMMRKSLKQQPPQGGSPNTPQG